MLETTYLTNHFLIAMPNLYDPHFFHTVTYVCMHNDEGAMGVVVNRPTNVKLKDILEHMDIPSHAEGLGDMPIYEGGPVDRERGFVIHQPLGEWDAMLPVANQIGVTTSRDILTAIGKGEGPEQFLIALGYAGWSAGQLEKEMSENAWLSVPADQQVIFNTRPEARWKTAASRLGIDLSLMSGEAGHD